MKKALLVLFVSLLMVQSCKKDNTNPPKDLTCDVTSANVTAYGGQDGTITVTVLTGNGNYTYSLNNTTTNTTGLFTGLTAGTYDVKVLDKENKSFTKTVTITQPDAVAPSVITTAASNITSTSSTLNGSVNPNGYITSTLKFEYGLTTAYGTSVTLTNLNGNTLTNVNANITNLTSNTTYHFRLVATNIGGTTYGADMSFTTIPSPIVETFDYTGLSQTGVVLYGKVNPNGIITTLVKFEYGLTTSYGNTIPLDNVILETEFQKEITGLLSNTTYHSRLVVENIGGTTNSNDITFTTLLPISLNILPASNITSTTATLNGTINSNNGDMTVVFEYNPGFNHKQIVVSGSASTQSFSVNVTGLTPNTTYTYSIFCYKMGGPLATTSHMEFTTLP